MVHATQIIVVILELIRVRKPLLVEGMQFLGKRLMQAYAFFLDDSSLLIKSHDPICQQHII